MYRDHECHLGYYNAGAGQFAWLNGLLAIELRFVSVTVTKVRHATWSVTFCNPVKLRCVLLENLETTGRRGCIQALSQMITAVNQPLVWL